MVTDTPKKNATDSRETYIPSSRTDFGLSRD